MKKPVRIIAVLIVLTGITACKKDATVPQKLPGKWEWIGSSGGLSGRQSTPGSTGLQIEWVFSEDHYETYYNSELRDQGPYWIVKAVSPLNDKEKNYLRLKSNDSNQVPIAVRLVGDTLDLDVDAYDGEGSRYVRKK